MTSPCLRASLRSLIEQGETRIAVSLTDTTFLDCSGVRVLMGILKELQNHGGDLTIREPSPQVIRILRATHADSFLPIDWHLPRTARL